MPESKNFRDRLYPEIGLNMGVQYFSLMMLKYVADFLVVLEKPLVW